MKNQIVWLSCILALSACQQNKPGVVIAAAATIPVLVAAPAQASAPAAAPIAVLAPAPETIAPIAPISAVVVAEQPASVSQLSAPVVVVPVAITATEKPVKPAVVTPVQAAAPLVSAPAIAVVRPQLIVSEADGLALAKKRNCFACHMVDKKVVGPAWKDVAAKYRGDAGAQLRLVNKIAKGGGGVWGSMAMPAQSQTSEAERIVLVRFILNLK